MKEKTEGKKENQGINKKAKDGEAEVKSEQTK